MVTLAAKKKTATKTRTVYRNAPKKSGKRKKNYGYGAIPGALATTGLVYANAPIIRLAVNEGLTKPQTYKNLFDRMTREEFIKRDLMYGLGGYAVGYGIKEFVPNSGVLGKAKKAVGGIAKKVPRVI